MSIRFSHQCWKYPLLRFLNCFGKDSHFGTLGTWIAWLTLCKNDSGWEARDPEDGLHNGKLLTWSLFQLLMIPQLFWVPTFSEDWGECCAPLNFACGMEYSLCATSTEYNSESWAAICKLGSATPQRHRSCPRPHERGPGSPPLLPRSLRRCPRPKSGVKDENYHSVPDSQSRMPSEIQDNVNGSMVMLNSGEWRWEPPDLL